MEIAGLKSDVAEVKSDIAEVKSDLSSAKEYIVGEIKEFMRPYNKSLDKALVDIERIKEKVKI